jgi:hypothetical protein
MTDEVSSPALERARELMPDYFARADAQEKRIAKASALVESLDSLCGPAQFAAIAKFGELKAKIEAEQKWLNARIATAREGVTGVAAPKVPYAKALRGRLARKARRHGKSRRRA